MTNRTQDVVESWWTDAILSAAVNGDLKADELNNIENQHIILNHSHLRAIIDNHYQALIDNKVKEARDSERKFLERLKLEFDANISQEAGEAWADSDAAQLVNNRLAQLTNKDNNSTEGSE